MSTQPNLEQLSKILKLLGDKTRLSIVGLLYYDDFCVCEFVEIFQTSQPAISQHLRKLKDSGLVKETRRSQWMIYSINKDSEFFPLIEDVIQHLPNQKEKVKDLEQQGLRISCD